MYASPLLRASRRAGETTPAPAAARGPSVRAAAGGGHRLASIGLPVVQRVMREQDVPVNNKVRDLIFRDRNVVKAMEYLREQYGIGTQSEYRFDLGNLEVNDGEHSYAMTKLENDGVVVTIDTSKLLQFLTSNDEGGFAALVSTLRHEYSHVLQTLRIKSVIEAKSASESEIRAMIDNKDYDEFMAFSEELLQTLTGGKGAKIASAPALSGKELDVAYLSAVSHYNKMSEIARKKKENLTRFTELNDVYALLVDGAIAAFQFEVKKLPALVGDAGFDDAVRASKRAYNSIAPSQKSKVAAELKVGKEAETSHKAIVLLPTAVPELEALAGRPRFPCEARLGGESVQRGRRPQPAARGGAAQAFPAGGRVERLRGARRSLRTHPKVPTPACRWPW